MHDFPYLGHGIGLRPPHYAAIASGAADVGWLEVISENFMVAGGNPRRVLDAVRDRFPVVMHGVSLSLGSVDPLDDHYLDALAALARDIEPAWISDHVCWSRFGGHSAHDLWPLPYTEEALAHVAERVARVQDRLGRRSLVENVSSYVAFAHSPLTEWEFLAALVAQADCGLLLDVNNVYVSARNHGFDPHEYITALPADRVGQVHLAGHDDRGTHLLDTHDHPVADPVWDLYALAIERFGPVSTLIEWDDAIPPLEVLLAERDKAAALAQRTLARRSRTAPATTPEAR